MKFSRDASVILIVAVVLIVSGLTFLSIRMFSGLTDEVEQEQFQLMETILNASIRAAEERALARAELIANLPSARKLLAARDRAGLLAEFGDTFKVQKEKYGVDQIQFHIPPATSFLRLHRPPDPNKPLDPADPAYGDDLSRFRPMVRLVNEDQVPRKGLVIARTGPAIFGVAPIKDPAGVHTGSVDSGLSFAPVLDSLKARYQMDLVLFMAEEPLKKFATGLPAHIITEQNRRGKYVMFQATHWGLMQQLVGESELATLTTTRYTRTVNRVTYGIVLLDLKNAAGDPLGVLACAKDFSASRAAAGRSLIWQSMLALCAILALAGVIIVVIRGFVLRPLEVLGERFTEFVEGHPPRPMEGEFCAEMQKFVEGYDRLRQLQTAEYPPERPAATPEPDAASSSTDAAPAAAAKHEEKS
ncbi:hypothetical protein DB346_05205 [Verrucomicrobia bacterium LW23]|nr:hypothetical protein DB346_05205 [Verrucomicrobia bacterium LW23]